MTATYDPALIERLVAEARRDDERMTPAPWTPEAMSTSRDYGRIDGPRWPVAQICYDDDRRPVSSEFDPGECVTGDINGVARTRNNLAAMADQLEAARREVERLTGHHSTLKTLNETLAKQSREADTVMADKLEAYEHENARLLTVHSADAEALRKLTADRDHWREARRIAMEAGEILKAERDALAAEVERLELLVKAHPDDIKSIVEENDRMHAAFDQAMTALRTPGMKVSSAFCTWCGQHWPKLDGETYEEARRHAMEHAETCPANDIRIERDALRAENERIRSAFAATAQQLHDACLDCGCARFVRTQLDEATAPTAGKEGE